MTENRAELLMRQASMTAQDYLNKALEVIDGAFGEGYAREHPELVDAFMQTAAANFAATFQADFLGKIAEKLEGISESIGDISDSNEEVAEALKGIGTHLKYLGTGDAGTTMGAMEFLATHTAQIDERRSEGGE